MPDFTAMLDAIASFDPNDPNHIDPNSIYCLHYPGRCLSMKSHCDVTRDAIIDYFDFDALANLMFVPCPESCSQPDSPGGLPIGPEEMAAQFKQHIPPQRMERLQACVGTLAVRHGDSGRTAYWKTVWDELPK